MERTTIDTEKGPVEVKKNKAIPELKERDTKKEGNYENHILAIRSFTVQSCLYLDMHGLIFETSI